MYVEGGKGEGVVFGGGGVVGEIHCVCVSCVVEDVAHAVVRGDVDCWIDWSTHWKT